MQQFINDDKGTVCIVSFGLRGSVMLNTAATVINSAHILLKLVVSMNIKYFIGISHGIVFVMKLVNQTATNTLSWARLGILLHILWQYILLQLST